MVAAPVSSRLFAFSFRLGGSVALASFDASGTSVRSDQRDRFFCVSDK
ncbi:hypothetical protein ARZXY2_4432 (plasmid) [Arthrobacter sp. ZXY-2]|nr:hypothetical protein ARZXY2_4432 [Arthrobacter sp. ZXY-2]